MFNHELFAATFARAVDVMRQAEAKEQQKGALRALVAISAGSSATVRCYDGQLSIDDVGIADTLQHVPVLITRMAAHGISEISVGRGAEPAELLALLRGLADSANAQSIKERLRQAKSTRVQVMLAPIGAPAPRRVSEVFDPPGDAAPAPGRKTRTTALKREEEEALAAWNDMHNVGGATSAMKELDLGFKAEDLPAASPETPMSAEPAQPQRPEVALPIPADSPLGQALLAVVLSPHDKSILDRLTPFAMVVEEALGNDQARDVVRALALITRLEADAPDGTPRNSYRITLRRMLSHQTLTQLAPLTTDPEYAGETAEVFAHAGSDGTEVLLGLLATAESIKERKGYMAALRGNPHGRGQIVAMLGHHTWFVARNVAELAGELKMEEAVEELGKLLNHADGRVCKAAAIALAKIGTSPVSELLLASLREGTPEARAFILTLIGSAQATAFTMPIVLMLETEEDAEVVRELCMALARIGTPQALAALEEGARKKGLLLSRRAKTVKESAELALQRARRNPGT